MAEALLPYLALLLIALTVPPWSRDAPARTLGMTLGVLAILAVYLWWRVTETVLPAQGLTPSTVFVWVVFLAELWLWYESVNLAALLLRRTDRTPEADAHEARLRAAAPEDLPHVDVFIATYNEPLDVLEKTINGALSLDWPAARLHVHVLDDGARDWLGEYCRARGVNHLTREGNAHAKAGNINAAVARTSAPFILVLDADFVPQRPMLMRAIGFFEDPKVGIVQMPHHFFNATPLQTNMNMRGALPDEQRFFFDVIQPGRDGWDCAFCCGSNGIIRRAALEEIGGAMPTDSVTEDMLLTLAMLRKGFVTRYLGERLALGLAPETLDAYFVQRARWAQGAVQMLYIPLGPFGPGLTPRQRLFFNPSHWLSQSVCQPIALATPAIFLLTGWPPLLHASLEEIFLFQIPAVAAAMLYMHFLAPRDFAPVASTVESVLQSFRLLPTVLVTLVRPKGHGFKVTPKGSQAGAAREDRFTALVALALILATGAGLFLNADYATRIVTKGELLPVVAFWSVFNMVVLLLVMTAAVPQPVFRAEERFAMNETVRLVTKTDVFTGDLLDASLSGALIETEDGPDIRTPETGDWLGIEIAGVGLLPARVRRRLTGAGAPRIGVAFHLPEGAARDRLVVRLFTEGRFAAGTARPRVASAVTMLARALARADPPAPGRPARPPGPPPAWLAAMAGRRSRDAPAAQHDPAVRAFGGA